MPICSFSVCLISWKCPDYRIRTSINQSIHVVWVDLFWRPAFNSNRNGKHAHVVHFPFGIAERNNKSERERKSKHYSAKNDWRAKIKAKHRASKTNKTTVRQRNASRKMAKKTHTHVRQKSSPAHRTSTSTMKWNSSFWLKATMCNFIRPKTYTHTRLTREHQHQISIYESNKQWLLF